MTRTNHVGPAPQREATRAGSPVIERASATDRAFLAMDVGQVPEQFGVVLLLDSTGGFDLRAARDHIADRIAAVARLRQQLVRTPLGCGGPIWVDDPLFDLSRHVRAVSCPAPGDEGVLLETALTVVETPLPRSAPLWSVVFVTDLADGRTAMVVVLHHVLADGVGGLAVLASLVDVAPAAGEVVFPRPRPRTGHLARDAWRRRLRGLSGALEAWRLLRESMAAGGGLHPPTIAPCSLNQRTGPRRRLAVVRTDASSVRAAAHRFGATTNDAVLVAVCGALHKVLLTRGEYVDELVVTVPVSGRRTDSASDLGNMVSPMLVRVPTTGDPGQRLETVATAVRAQKGSATGPPPIALLGWLFRPLARAGGYRWYMNRQQRFHTLVSHVRGPSEPLTFGGSTISSAIPIGVAEGGNATVYFEVLSYAGSITIAAIVDPDHFPDLDVLVDALDAELGHITHATTPLVVD